VLSAGPHAHRGTTSLTGAASFLGNVAAPASHYCCDGLTRPVLLTLPAWEAVGAFFRKLTGDSRVIATFESTIAAAPIAIPGRETCL
jgi:hypothetical protein